MSRSLIFRQLFDSVSCTYTYILGCAATREALIIDPVIEKVPRDLGILSDLRLKLLYAANTHVHADHVTGSGELRKRAECRSVVSRESGGRADLLLSQGDTLKFGALELEVRSTPGHTDGCVTYVHHSGAMAFTGDALLIRGCGRTDFQQGCPERLYESVHSQILSLPPHYTLYPGHDYNGLTATSVEEELAHNKRLTKSKTEFVEIMKNLNLAYPKQIDKSLPANLVDGILEDMDENVRKQVEESMKT